MSAMTVVFVHGVPETPIVWRSLLAELDRPGTVALSLPGFDGARPTGFGATMDEYAAWLVAELERVGEPVDLVGHDWGGLLVVRVVSTRPGLVRSWVTDAAGVGDAGFGWHDLAKVWQTPQAGEDFWDQQLAASVEDRAAGLQMFGVPGEPALEMAARLSRTMAECILDLYRSAVDIGKQWGQDFAAIPDPGLVIIPSEDPFQRGGAGARGAVPGGGRGGPARRAGRRRDSRSGRAGPLVDAAGPGPGGHRAG
jgi:pimeloyl-ACP methyl ester carboxylesterase